MKRILEPEVMDNPSGAKAYAEADFSAPNQRFADRLVKEFGQDLGVVLDIGCGPADIPIRIARLLPAPDITGVDASDVMLALARDYVRAEGLEDAIHLVHGRLPSLPFAGASFDTILSNSLLHHLPDPDGFWNEVQRLAKPNANFMLIDLFRPMSIEQAALIVETAAKGEHPILQNDFYNSLLAAFTVDEVREQLRKARLEHLQVEVVSERHFLVFGRI